MVKPAVAELSRKQPSADIFRETVSTASAQEQENEAVVLQPATPKRCAETPPLARVGDNESATEPEDEPEPSALPVISGQGKASPSPPPQASGSGTTSTSRQTSSKAPGGAAPADKDSLEDAPLARPNKKAKRVESSSSEDESEGERRRKLAQRKGASKGAKQPLKRGGRRF